MHRQSSGQLSALMVAARGGQRIAALVPADAAEAMERAEDVADIEAARAALADPGPSIPLEQVLAEYADDLAAFPDER